MTMQPFSYQVFSTVLGTNIATVLPDGTPLKRGVFAGGAKIAELRGTGTNTYDTVTWKTSDPVSGTVINYTNDGTANHGGISEQSEPLGQKIAVTDPTEPFEPTVYEQHLNYASDPTWQCTNAMAEFYGMDAMPDYCQNRMVEVNHFDPLLRWVQVKRTSPPNIPGGEGRGVPPSLQPGNPLTPEERARRAALNATAKTGAFDNESEPVPDSSIPHSSTPDLFGELEDSSGITQTRPVPPSIRGSSKFQKKLAKAKKRLQSKDCQKFLSQLSSFASTTQIEAALDSHPAFSGKHSTNILVRDSGIHSPSDLQDILNAPDSETGRISKNELTRTVAQWFLYNGNNAVTNNDPSFPGVYYNDSSFDSQTILHETLHYVTGMGDLALAKALGLTQQNGADFKEPRDASSAIHDAINEHCK